MNMFRIVLVDKTRQLVHINVFSGRALQEYCIIGFKLTKMPFHTDSNGIRVMRQGNY